MELSFSKAKKKLNQNLNRLLLSCCFIIRENSPCKTDPLKPVLIVKMRFEEVEKKINNACYYVIQVINAFFQNIDSINIYFKVGKIVVFFL